jgi:hypothetical protein
MAPDEDPSGTPIPLYNMRKFATGATPAPRAMPKMASTTTRASCRRSR